MQKSILVLEDDLLFTRQIQRMLESVQAQATYVTTKKAAWEHMQQAVVEIVIMDVVVEDGLALTFLEQLKADARFAHIPVIVMSSFAAEQNRSRAAELGAMYFLDKASAEFTRLPELVTTL